MLKRLSAVLLALAVAGPAMAAGLNDNAQKILAASKAQSNLNQICNDRGQVTDVVTKATKSLMQKGEISGNPRPDARSAGMYIMQNCGKL